MHSSLRLPLKSGLTLQSTLRRQGKWKDHMRARNPETHLKQWAGVRQGERRKMSVQPDRWCWVNSVLPCVSGATAQAHVPACRSAAVSGDWHLRARHLWADCHLGRQVQMSPAKGESTLQPDWGHSDRRVTVWLTLSPQAWFEFHCKGLVHFSRAHIELVWKRLQRCANRYVKFVSFAPGFTES